MNRNAEDHFSKVPVVKARRSSFPLHYTHMTTMNAGQLVPFFVQEVLPGDTFSYDQATLIRLSTSIHPTMDNSFMDVYYFFVPNRLIYDNWKYFMGENPEPWANDVVYSPCYFQIKQNHDIQPGSILNYLGLPAGSNSNLGANLVDISLFPFNAYCLIWNYYFRVQALQPEIPIYKGEGNLPNSFIDAYTNFVGASWLNNGSCLPVAKTADYFTSALPGPQKGADVLVPVSGDLNIHGPIQYTDARYGYGPLVPDGTSISMQTISSSSPADLQGKHGLAYNDGGVYYGVGATLPLGDVSGLEITVNNLRLAIQTQRLLEKDARGGTFYQQVIFNHFGVRAGDSRVQIPEYLGGKRIPINILEVTQTSETSSTSPLGNLSGKSVTADRSNLFTKSFVEHGFVIGVCCVRSDHTYSQGIEKFFTHRDDRLKYYWPVFAHLGEQPIYNSEIKLNSSNFDGVFGYQEAWAEYRYKPNRISGYFSPQVPGNLASWHYGDYYSGSTAPTLSDAWVRQGTSEIDRTLVVPSATMHQYLVDFYVTGKMVRPMPVFSIPGLMDHE